MHDNIDSFRAGRRARVLRPDQVKAQTPAIVMIDPKYPHNVGAALRAASCFGIAQAKPAIGCHARSACAAIATSTSSSSTIR
jgi:tRNA C32,U32 (ribose-2'-O)-methylase TrmJ